jgi:hypothetical protein
MTSASFSGLAAFAMMGFTVAFGALLVFMVLIQPIWCIVDCAVDTRRGTAGKVIWIILLVVLYGFVNWFYGAFAASGRVLKVLTRLAWIFGLVLLVGFAVLFFTHAEFRRGIEQQWQHRRELIVMADSVSPAMQELRHGF